MPSLLNITFYACILMFSTHTCLNWFFPASESKSYSYCYAPGILSSELLCARYCPQFKASTGETVTCLNGIETIPAELVTSCNFPEIELYQKKDMLGIRYATNYKLFLAEHMKYGIAVAQNKKPGETIACHSINFAAINVAQKNDIKALSQHIIFHKKQFKTPEKSLCTILYGSSRGAAAIFNYAATYGSTSCDALVCEGIFDTVEHTSAHGTWGTFFKVGLLKSSWLTRFKKNGLSPLSLYKNIRKDMPIALITSRADTIVPYACTYNLYKKLKAVGHTAVHLLVLKQSTHNAYAFGPEKEIYRNFVHAFYQKYNLPYIPEYALAGIRLL